MPDYNLEIEDLPIIQVTKKRGMRSLRMRISPKGEVLVSTPYGVSKTFVYDFVQSKSEWIQANLPKQAYAFKSGLYFGRNTQLIINDVGQRARNSSYISGNRLYINLTESFDNRNASQQKYIEKKILDCMQHQAESELLPRLLTLSEQINHPFNQAYVKPLISKWGSCDSDKNIILNLFLLQVPQKLQDYVILHELTHTKHMNHSSEFWSHMADLMPSYKLFRTLLKKHKTIIIMRERE